MKTISLLAGLLVVAAANVGIADSSDGSSPSAVAARCEAASMTPTPLTSAERADIAIALFKEQCVRYGGELVNDDFGLDEHFTLPDDRRPRGPNYPLQIVQKHQKGILTIAFVVDTDGRVTWDSVTHSCGYPEIDTLVSEYLKGVTYNKPALMYGKPVRAFITQEYEFDFSK